MGLNGLGSIEEEILIFFRVDGNTRGNTEVVEDFQ
jgi:hypothetical protein